jgi:hypothetical protein
MEQDEDERPIELMRSDWGIGRFMFSRFFFLGGCYALVALVFLLRDRDHNSMMFAIWTGAPFATLLLLWLFRRSDAQARKNKVMKIEGQICLKCGYDLRGSPLRCPECFTATPLAAWLEEHPLEKCKYLGLLTPQAHSPEEPLPAEFVETQERLLEEE